MRGGVLKYAAQATSQIDAEIGKKDHFWMETKYKTDWGEVSTLYRSVPQARLELVEPGCGRQRGPAPLPFIMESVCRAGRCRVVAFPFSMMIG